jgi:hypothetical protein
LAVLVRTRCVEGQVVGETDCRAVAAQESAGQGRAAVVQSRQAELSSVGDAGLDPRRVA